MWLLERSEKRLEHESDSAVYQNEMENDINGGRDSMNLSYLLSRITEERGWQPLSGNQTIEKLIMLVYGIISSRCYSSHSTIEREWHKTSFGLGPG